MHARDLNLKLWIYGKGDVMIMIWCDGNDGGTRGIPAMGCAEWDLSRNTTNAAHLPASPLSRTFHTI